MGVDAATGSLLAALASAGVFRLGGTLVGTHAFRLYEGVLGVRYAFDQAAQTNDVDIASFERLSLALGDTVSEPLQSVLRDFAFEPVPTLDPGLAWRWRQTRADLLVEFLTPSFEAEEGLRPLAALGVHAQALHFLNFVLAEPISVPVTYRSGVVVQVPRPERFAIHKLIVADRRREGADSLKSVKDRLQAAFLIEILAEDRPDDLLEAWETARAAGPRWRERLDASLARLPDTRRRLQQLSVTGEGAA
ncbi:nucleotidyltransferase family protein [Methylobacterium iners]|nr:GSU2403 family nucleotidyltransferase fold protein [Methylobacterium iners]